MFRAAAIVFASRGLLAHALCAYDGAKSTLQQADRLFDLERLAELARGDLALRQKELRRVGGLAFLEALRVQTDGLDRGGTVATPFLSALPPPTFAELASACDVRRVSAGARVLEEGEMGDSLFAIGEGRLVVTCTPSKIDPREGSLDDDEEERTDPSMKIPRKGVRKDHAKADVGRRVFLSALTAGDLFGEFSFLTSRPRSASVEAVTACRLLEIRKSESASLVRAHASLRDALEAFYKERVLEWMLAKNEVFSLLEPEARRGLLSQCGVYDIPVGKTVIREGELHDAMYFIRRGEVEVTIEDNGVDVFVNKLHAGEFFGEIAALEGGPRTATVRAVTDLEVFRITRADLQQLLAGAPRAKARLGKATKARAAELRDRIAEQRQVLGTT